MKIVFLDIDGVLNSNDWYVRRQAEIAMEEIHKQYPFYEIDPKAVEQLNRITDTTGAVLVLSSTWRLGQTLENRQELFKTVGITGQLVGMTIHMNAAGHIGYTIPRGCEIDHYLDGMNFQRINWSKKTQEEYLEKTEVKNYIILDDDSDMLYNQREHFVKVPAMHGLTSKLADKCISILETPVVDLYYRKKSRS